MSSPADATKKALRSEMRKLLAAMPPDERQSRSIEACKRLIALPEIQRSSIVMLYMPLPSEVDLTPAAVRCFQMGQTVCVPSVDWSRRDMTAIEVNTFDDEAMDIDERGLRTPSAGRPIPVESIDVVIIPGLGFDTEGWRLGRGGGYYDRFLDRVNKRTRLVGIGFDQQMVEVVPHEPHDVRMQVIVTDRRTTQTRRGAGSRR